MVCYRLNKEFKMLMLDSGIKTSYDKEKMLLSKRKGENLNSLVNDTIKMYI